MVYKPLAVRVALIAGFRRALPVLKYMIVVVVAVVMWESPQGFPRGVGRVENRLFGFPCFPYPGISMARFGQIRVSVSDRQVVGEIFEARRSEMLIAQECASVRTQR